MKLKVKITGPKVHDVGYRFYLLGLAMSNRIKGFEAYNVESDEGEVVSVLADGKDEAIKAFYAQVETKRPAQSVVSSIVFEEVDEDIMKIGEYAQFCSTIQLNKAIPALLEVRDSLKVNTEATLEVRDSLKVNTAATLKILEEISGLREDIQPGYANALRQVQADIRALKDRVGMQ